MASVGQRIEESGRPAFASALLPGRFRPGRPRSRGSARPKPIKILHIHGRMGRGGAEMRTLEIFRNIDRERFRFAFCALSGRPGELDEEIRALGGEVYLMRRSPAGFARRFQELLRQQEFDVVHSHLHHTSGYLLRLAARCGTPVRVAHFRSSHTDRVSGLGRRIHSMLWRLWVDRCASEAMMRAWIDRHATSILGVSRWALTRAWSPHWNSDPRCQVVYDGLEPASFDGAQDRQGVRRELGLPKDAPLYLHVGRMTQAKNHLRVLSIFSEVVRRRPEARLLLVGRSEKTIEGRVRSRRATLGIAQRAIVAGERKDVPRLLKAADLLIFPSLWEGLGDVVLEACAAGTPALCSDLPSIREIAGQLPGVRCLSLDEPDGEWARLAEQMADAPVSDRDRRIALQTFVESVFTVQRCTETLCRVWQGRGAESKVGGAADG